MCDPVLVTKIFRNWPQHVAWTTWQEAPEHIAQELQLRSRRSLQSRLAAWKETNCVEGKAATRWLHNTSTQGIPDILRPNGEATANCEEGFAEIGKFWTSIWNRNVNIPELQTLEQQMQDGIWRAPFPDRDWIPTVEEFLACARDAAGSSAGSDGWAGTELSVVPPEACAAFLTLIRRWDSRGAWPHSWNQLRQVHIPKEQGVGPVPPSGLRPIAVLSIWYRTLMSAMLRRDSMRRWLPSAVPESCHGGIKGRSVTSAVASILPHLEAGSPALALDYKKCFDMLDPKLVLAILKLHKWPPGLLTLLQHMWQGQLRWLELGHLSAKQPFQVSSSMPQGDPVSPMGLILVLADAAAALDHAGVKQSVFLDDRVLVAPDVRQILRGKNLWLHWSRRLGLVENEDKIIALAQKGFHRHAFIRSGIQSNNVRSQMRILGVDYVTPTCAEAGAVGETRIAQAIQIAARISKAPVPLQVRRSLYRTRVIPKACWGWWFHDFPTKAVNSLFNMFRKVAYVHKMCSRDLRVMLEGHMFCPSIMALSASVREFRVAVANGLPWATGKWFNRISSAFCGLGWSKGIGSTWDHPHENSFDLLNDHKGLVLHQIRESWRRARWQGFLAKKRRDSAQFRQARVPYDRSTEVQTSCQTVQSR